MSNPLLPVAVDAMGGDDAPDAIIAGARLAVEAGLEVTLVGDPDRLGDVGGLQVVAASEVIGMDEDPARAVRRKKDASMLRAAELVRDGKASAFVGAGNTGATMGSALLRIGRMKGVKRPAIAAVVPAPGTDRTTVLLDVGANADCTAAMLEQFARMGAGFAHAHLGVGTPRVATLSIGEEAGKGNLLLREASTLLNDGRLEPGAIYVGNVEGRDIIRGVVDVVVTDGFTGNVALKTMEGTAKWITGFLRGVLGAGQTDLVSESAAADEAWRVLDPDTHNGAILLGLEGVCVIGHGSSSPAAICSAIQTADLMVRGGVIEKIRKIL